MIIYSKSSGNTPAAIGRLETPIKMIIEHESDLLTKKGGIRDLLFNVEKSNRFGETLIGNSEFGVFSATAEGEGAEADTVNEVYSKFIEHIQFMKEFTVTAEMMEDAVVGIAQDAKRRAEGFTRAYYKTMNKICECALTNGLNTTASFANATLDLTSPDGKPLFASNHSYGEDGAQSNYFYGNIFGDSAATRADSCLAFEESLYALSVKLRNMRDENGEPLGYTADTVILPGNRPGIESIAKKVCGSFGQANDVNLNFGAWNIVVLPSWHTSDDRVMIMSNEANKNLSGNMFYNRVPLTVTSWVDNHTGNYVWNGRCRFGVGFGSYKHILLAVNSKSAVEGASAL